MNKPITFERPKCCITQDGHFPSRQKSFGNEFTRIEIPALSKNKNKKEKTKKK